MTTETNKSLIRRHFELLNARDFDGVMGLVATDLVNHAAIPEAQGSEGLRRIFTKLMKALPDLRFDCEEMIAEGDKVVCLVTVKGTQTGPFEMTRLRLPATGRETKTQQIHVFRIADGKVIEHWAGRDDLLMFRQLGHSPFTGAEA